MGLLLDVFTGCFHFWHPIKNTALSGFGICVDPINSRNVYNERTTAADNDVREYKMTSAAAEAAFFIRHQTMKIDPSLIVRRNLKP